MLQVNQPVANVAVVALIVQPIYKAVEAMKRLIVKTTTTDSDSEGKVSTTITERVEETPVTSVAIAAIIAFFLLFLTTFTLVRSYRETSNQDHNYTIKTDNYQIDN